LKNYELLIFKFNAQFGDRELDTITPEEVLSFLTHFTEGTKQSTKRLRYAILSSFFNFVRNSLEKDFHSPCDTSLLRKLFKDQKPRQWKILEKEVVDEMIFRTTNLRNRIILELMARGGMRVGEVLKLTADDIDDRKVRIREPKSGKEDEMVFIPHKIAERLKQYIREKGIMPNDRICRITYPAARMVVKKAGKLIGIERHAATYASRSGTPLEIISKIILRHSNLSTTQRYLGKVNDVEAMRWIDSLFG
jgi:integrase